MNFVSLEDDSPPSAERPRLTVDLHAAAVRHERRLRRHQLLHDQRAVRRRHLRQVTPVNCDDGNPCTDDICDCGSGCINDNICNDGFSCTTDTCDPMTRRAPYVPNNAVCTTQCFAGTCLADPDATIEDPVTGCTGTAAPDGTGCVDGDPCTNADQCTGGNCAGSPVICTPLDQCHDAGTCSGGVCSNPPKVDGAVLQRRDALHQPGHV